jgi:endonuclease/exonuclease/phosphatase family metal-dependent hydrolase
MKILSFNACILPLGITNAGSWNDKKRERLAIFFEKYSPDCDVILLQEIWDTVLFCHSWSLLVEKYAAINGFNYCYNRKREFVYPINNGLMILSKHPIVETNAMTFKNSAGLQRFIPNGVLHTRISYDIDISLDLYVTHIHGGPQDSMLCNRDSTAVQLGQIRELRDFIRKTTVGNYIVTGDFNCDAINDREVYNRAVDIMQSESLLMTKHFPSTYPIPNQGSFLVNKSFIGQDTCIDHVFTNMVNIEAEILCTTETISDHAIIEIKLF